MEKSESSENFSLEAYGKLHCEIISNNKDLNFKKGIMDQINKEILFKYDNSILVNPLYFKLYENLIFLIYQEFDLDLNKVTDVKITVIKGKNDEYSLSLTRDLKINIMKISKVFKTKIEIAFNKNDSSYICFVLIENFYFILLLTLHKNIYKLLHLKEYKEGKLFPINITYSFNSVNEPYDCFIHKSKLVVFKYNLYDRALYLKDVEINIDFNKIGIDKVYICDLTLCYLVFSSIRKRNLYIYHFKSSYLQKISSIYKELLKGVYFLHSINTPSFLNDYFTIAQTNMTFITIHSDKSIKLWELNGNSDAVISIKLTQQIKLSYLEISSEFIFDFYLEGYYAILHLNDIKKLIILSIVIKENKYVIERINEVSYGEFDNFNFFSFNLLIEEDNNMFLNIINYSNNEIIKYDIGNMKLQEIILPCLNNFLSQPLNLNYNSEIEAISKLIDKVVIPSSYLDYCLKDKLEKVSVDLGKLLDFMNLAFECGFGKLEYDKRLSKLNESLYSKLNEMDSSKFSTVPNPKNFELISCTKNKGL